jgi:hypothetical protein
MDQQISTSITLLDPTFKEMFKLITPFMNKDTWLALAKTCKYLFGLFKDCLIEQNYFLLRSPQFNEEYSNYTKKFLGDGSKFETGWNRMNVSITVRGLNSVCCREYPFVSGICLDVPFKLSKKTLRYAKYIRHVSLNFAKGLKGVSTISSLESFPNSKSIMFLGAKFNDHMLRTISSLRFLDDVLFYECELGNYLSKIAKIYSIKRFHVARCACTEIIKFPEQSTKVDLFGICAGDQLDLSDCSNLSEL